jgi:hypothetical protein
MSEHPKGGKNDELIETLKETEQLHETGKREAQGLTGQFQLGSDEARFVRDLAERQLIQREAAERLTTSFRQRNDAARAALHTLRENKEVFRVVSSGTAFFTSTTVAQTFSVGDMDLDLEALGYVRRVTQLYDRQPILEQVRQGLVRCGLDRGRGKRSALEHLEEAERAYAAPSGEGTSPIAVLVALREAIGTAVDDMHTRCRPQERGGNWTEKVLSIGRRCGSATAPSDRFPLLAQSIRTVVGELSGGKRGDMEREAVLLKYVEGLTFLQSLLDAIDESRLRE